MTEKVELKLDKPDDPSGSDGHVTIPISECRNPSITDIASPPVRLDPS